MRRVRVVFGAVGIVVLFAASDCGKSSCDMLEHVCYQCACGNSRSACLAIAARQNEDTCEATVHAGSFCDGDTSLCHPPTTSGGYPRDGVLDSSSSGCMDVSSCEKCNGCVTNFDCGVASTNITVCHCNGNDSGTSSLGLYTAFFGCLCGGDGKSGQCGAKCSKSCTGTGKDAADCTTCLSTAAGTYCKNEYNACNADK